MFLKYSLFDTFIELIFCNILESSDIFSFKNILILFLIYFIGAPHVFTRFPIYRAFMQSMPFFGIIAISATFVVTLGEIDLSFPSLE